MLSKQKRLSGADVAMLFKAGRPAGGPFFVARYLKSDRTGFAIIAPKTIAKTAVLRNSLRRTWSASLREALRSISLKSGTYAFVLKKEAITISPADRISALVVFLKKVQ